MEVCNHSINDFELIPRIDENIRPPLLCFDHSMIDRRRFQRTDGSRPHRNNPSSFLLCHADQVCCLSRDGIKFAVHDMIFDLIDLNRAKCAETNMQCDEAEVHPLLPQPIHKRLRKMESCRRRCCRAFLSAVNRLVTLRILQCLMNVRWKRHRSQTIQNLFKDSLIGEFYNSSAEIRMFKHLAGQFMTKRNHRADAHFFAGLHKNFPSISFQLA